jgi:hypothetical protein
MKDNQKKYLDEIHLPFFKDPFYLSNMHFFTPSHLPPPVSIYCENTYGIVGDEIEYVWVKYSVTIKDKTVDKDEILTLIKKIRNER